MQGKTVNGFVLQRMLGKGGMAEVWYAENEIGMKAAVKIMSEMLAHNPVMQERFLNEAKVMVKLDHPNIRKVYGYGNVDDRPAIIMEYLDGTDLKMKMKSGERFTEEELEKWWNQLADALNYTHAQDVVHRDIKPSNIFIDQQGNAKLLDFGIAKVTDTTTGTQTGSTLGTRIYMSPEQVKDPKRVGTPSDVYSLAVSFVHLLSGEAPYDISTSSDYDIQVSIVTKPVDMSKVPPEWQRFLTPYLNKEADQRPALRHFSIALPDGAPADEDGTVADMGQEQTPTSEKPIPQASQKEEPVVKKKPTKKTPASESPDKPKSKKGLWIALAALLLAAAAVAVWFLTRDPYKQIDQWISESEQLYGKFHIEAPLEDYATAVDSLNAGYVLRDQALQALEALRPKNPDSLAFALRMRKCDSLDSLYVGNILPIVDKELLYLSVAEDTLAAVARLQQLEKFFYFTNDSVGRLKLDTIEQDIDFLCHAELFWFLKDGRNYFIDQSGNVVFDFQGYYNPSEKPYGGLIKFSVGGKYGFINKMGRQIAEPQFDVVSRRLSDGMIWVKVDGKYGFIDKLGNMVVDPQYEYVCDFYEGLAKVRVDGRYGFIDKSGNMVIEPQFKSAGSFFEGLARVKIDNQYGYINKSGDIVIRPLFNSANDFSNGLAWVKIDDKCGFIDTLGKIVVSPQYESAAGSGDGGDKHCVDFWEGMARVSNKGKYGFINESGVLVVDVQYDDASMYCSDGMMRVKLKGKYGFVDKSGNLVVKTIYDEAWDFCDGLARVKTNGKYGFIDKTGRMVVPAQYDDAQSFSFGLARVGKNGKYGFVDKSGNLVVPVQYDVAGRFEDGLARVQVNGKYGYIDNSGTMVIEARFDSANDFSRGLARVRLDGKNYYIDKQGNIVFEW